MTDDTPSRKNHVTGVLESARVELAFSFYAGHTVAWVEQHEPDFFNMLRKLSEESLIYITRKFGNWYYLNLEPRALKFFDFGEHECKVKMSPTSQKFSM